MNYSNIINNMTWSYSRIKSFQTCPYKFFLRYILEMGSRKLFFAEYGSFIHKIIEDYLSQKLSKNELEVFYLVEFKNYVTSKAPNSAIFENYFKQGLEYIKNISFPYIDIVDVERKFEFEIENRRFVGFVDIIAKSDNDIVIIDNKSRALKHRTNRKKATKSDIELDEYLKQLYIYSIPIKEKYGVFPKALDFNCFRTQSYISEAFDIQKFEETKKWAVKTIDKIANTDKWYPNPNYFVCNHLCEMCHHCEYSHLV